MQKMTIAAAAAAVLTYVAGFMSPALAQVKNPEGVDPTHYQCYRVSELKPLRPQSVKLADQFTRSQTRIARAAFICTPVEKNGEPPKDKDTHLTCYTVPAKDARKKVRMIHQFGEHDLAVGGSIVLCLPSLKKVL
jgi:hypothetical protein